jgi:hypothetical protein
VNEELSVLHYLFHTRKKENEAGFMSWRSYSQIRRHGFKHHSIYGRHGLGRTLGKLKVSGFIDTWPKYGYFRINEKGVDHYNREKAMKVLNELCEVPHP